MTLFVVLASIVSSTVTSVVAHQGGWDEILLIAAPVLLIVGALRVAKRRVEASAATEEHVDPHGDAAR